MPVGNKFPGIVSHPGNDAGPMFGGGGAASPQTPQQAPAAPEPSPQPEATSDYGNAAVETSVTTRKPPV